MEKTVVSASVKTDSFYHPRLLVVFTGAFLLGCYDGLCAYVFAFLYLAYFYMRDEKECRIAGIGILIGSCLCGLITTYFYALGMTIFFLVIHGLRLFNQNVYRSLPMIAACLSIPYGVYAFHLDLRVLCIAFFTYLSAMIDHREIEWVQKKLILTSQIYGIFFITLALLASSWISGVLGEWLFAALVLTAAFFCEPLPLIVLMGLVSVSTPTLVMPLEIIAAAAWICVMKQEKYLLCSGLLLMILWFDLSLPNTALFLIGSLTSFLYDEKKLPFHGERHRQLPSESSSSHILNKQINHFSGIFTALSDYYEQISDVEAQMLSDMAKALKYCADTLKKVDTTQSQKQRILKALEGYQYEVDVLELEQQEDGHLAIELEIRNIKKNEIQQTLLPLLEVLTHEHLNITQLQHKRFTRGAHVITLENQVPFQIDSYADAQKNMYESCGDTFSVFRYRNTVISMISDGMGSGEHAATSSRLITNLFQRMVVSGIPKADAIKCINKLLQSDAYATLDVVCFDCAAGKAYIFKSAACPTFLIRNHELYEVNGSSLPVGIVSSIEPDCFVADLQDGDEYLMISDGIFMDEIYEWLKERNTDNAKASIEDLMEVLRKRQRLDDSTAVLSRVHSVV